MSDINNKSKPIKRHSALQPLSREHHHGLLLCWKIRQGFKRDISPERIKVYADWFWETHLAPHFEAEEKYLFPILPADNENVKKALLEHQRLKRLFHKSDDLIKTLNRIEEELEQHIRFEERILFNEIQQAATEAQLQDMVDIHSSDFCDNLSDEFWKE